MEIGERFTAELWVKFGEQWHSRERARARRSKLTEESSRRPRFRRAGRGRAKWTRPLCAGDAMEVMHATEADERGHRWRTDDIWQTDGALAIHDGELGFDSEETTTA